MLMLEASLSVVYHVIRGTYVQLLTITRSFCMEYCKRYLTVNRVNWKRQDVKPHLKTSVFNMTTLYTYGMLSYIYIPYIHMVYIYIEREIYFFCIVLHILYIIYIKFVLYTYIYLYYICQQNRMWKAYNYWKMIHKRLYLSTALLFALDINKHRCKIVEHNTCSDMAKCSWIYNSRRVSL